jgi:FkbM family methyltransferase
MNFPEKYLNQRERIRNLLDEGWSLYAADLDLLLHLKWLGFRPRTIYDIGASNSVWSTMASLVFPEAGFEMFEPLAEISRSYHSARQGNPVIARFFDNVRTEIHPVALGTDSGTCQFQWIEGNEAGSTSLQTIGQLANSKIVEMPMHRLDDYAAVKRLNPPDMIKLDTQGSEMEIFLGAAKSLNAAKVIFIECWLNKGYGPKTPLFLDIANHLFSAGYDLFAIGDEYRDRNGVAQSKDAVFVRRNFSINPDPPFESHL